MIIIIGDSWGVGEWHRTGLSGPGFGQYLMCHDRVVNLSVGAASNTLCLDRLFDFVDRYKIDRDDSIYWVVTCFTRCWTDWSVLAKTEIGLQAEISRQIDLCLERANTLAADHHTTINLIGGLCDMDTLDVERYQHLRLVVPSWGRLITEDYVTDILGPTGWDKLGLEIRSQRRDLLDEWVMIADRVLAKEKFQAKIFLNDHCHPDRRHHKLLHDYLWPEWSSKA